MAGYIYLPVATQEMQTFAKDWQAGQVAKNKTAYKLLHNVESGPIKGMLRKIGRGCLCGLVATDKLYVLSHGAARGSRNIGASRGGKEIKGPGQSDWTGGTLKMYSPAELAKLLESEGLLKSFVDLRIFACGSAVVPAGETQSYAERLKAAMVALGYSLITVTGYNGGVQSAYGSRSLTPETYSTVGHKGVTVDGSMIRASQGKQVF